MSARIEEVDAWHSPSASCTGTAVWVEMPLSAQFVAARTAAELASAIQGQLPLGCALQSLTLATGKAVYPLVNAVGLTFTVKVPWLTSPSPEELERMLKDLQTLVLRIVLPEVVR